MDNLGKTWGLRRLADRQGRFKMLAIDQRPPLMQVVAKARGIEPGQVGFADLCAIKRLLAAELVAEASAILVDPNWGYPAAIDLIPAHTGLIVSLEDHRVAETPGGRRTNSIAQWSVEKIKRLGADGVKVLAWYRPDAEADVRRHQRAYVASVGKACAEFDIPFVFELLAYAFAGDKNHTDAYVEDTSKRPRLVIDSVREFADPKYGVDLFKLESPVPAAQLPRAEQAEEEARVQALFDKMGRAAGRPWVVLSAGASMAQFARVLDFSFKAGASGFLAGRAIWGEALAGFPDLAACREELRARSVPYFRELNAMADRSARGFDADYGPLRTIEREGQFASAVAGT